MSEITLSHRVTYAEVDAQAVVFHSRYLEWMDAAAYEWFRLNGWSPPDLRALGFDFVVVHAEITYRQAARLDDLLQVRVTAERVGRTSFRLAYAVEREGDVLVTAVLDYVNVMEGSPAPLPLAIRDFLHARMAR